MSKPHSVFQRKHLQQLILDTIFSSENIIFEENDVKANRKCFLQQILTVANL